MSARPRALGAGSLLALVLLACGPGEAAPETPIPGAEASEVAVESLLLITIDTLRADALDGGPDRRAPTPSLDRLAAAGRSHSRAHAHNVMTLPSHANVLTGLYPYQHGVRDNLGYTLGEGVPTAATLLRSAGFATAAVVGAFPLDARYGLDRGFDLYDDDYPRGSQGAEFVLSERRGDEVVERGLAWWRAHAGERRFLWLHLFDPHAPYDPPEPFASRLAGRPYLGEVAAVDAYLAPLLEPFLDGREPPTLIVVTADHGEGLGEHGELTHGLFAYESTLRVPLLLWAPGLPPGRSSVPARHVDLLPTMLDAAGVEAPAGLAGRSLLEPPEPGVTTYFETLNAHLNRGWAPLRGMIESGKKLISLPIPELYDLDQDPAEERNLFAERPRRAEALSGLLGTESPWPPAGGGAEVSAEEREALASLGYLEGSPAAKERYGPEDDPKRLVAVDRQIHRFIELYQRRRLEEATELAREVVASQPQMGVGHYHLAQVLLERGRLGEAIEAMERALEAGVATAALKRQLGLSLAQAGQPRRALPLLAPLAEEGDREALHALALVLSEAGRQDEAKAALERLLALDPGSAAAHEALAVVALRREAWEEAAASAERALARNPELAQSWNYLGVARYNLGRKRQALDAWQRAVDLDPAAFDVLYNLGIAAADAGETAQARAALERFVAAAPRERYGADLGRARALLARLGGGAS